jgi:hypothetical protein
MTIAVEAGFLASIDQHMQKAEKHMRHPLPVFKESMGGITIPAGAVAPVIVLFNTFPSQGRLWNLLQANFTGSDGHSVATGLIADLYASTNVTASPPIPDLIVGNVSVPSFPTFSRQVVWIDRGEQPFLLLYGTLTAGQVVNCVLSVAEYKAGDVEATVIE